MELALGAETPLAADIVFRYMQRLGQALAGRIERLREADAEEAADAADAPAPARTVATLDEGQARQGGQAPRRLGASPRFATSL